MPIINCPVQKEDFMILMLASRGDIDNPRNWSGTPYNLQKHFAKVPGLKVGSLNWQINRNILRIYHVLFGKLMFIYGSAKDPFLSPFCERKIAHEISRLGYRPDFILFISDYIIPDSIVGKANYAAYIDSFHELEMQYFDGNRRGIAFWSKYYGAQNKESLDLMTLVFTQNEWTRQCLLSEYNLSPEKVHNVGFGINTEPFIGEKNYDDELLLIVLRKGTEKYKGLFLLLDAFKLLKKRRLNVRLAVVGTQLDDKPDGVTYYFNQQRSVTVELFRNAVLYVMPALHEPNGITYLEALANKTPIVGLNRFSFPEFCNNGEWGFPVNEEDPVKLAEVLDDALSDKERLKQMSEKGQNFVFNRYRWDVVVNKMIALMQQNK